MGYGTLESGIGPGTPQSVSVDLNADLGEGFGGRQLTDDEALLTMVTSANVACGFHAGDPSTMRRVCALAAERGVRIGAQVSYHDLPGFGRRPMDLPARELADEVAYQIGALRVFAQAAGTDLAYVKPHGALYNRIVWDEAQADAVVDGIMLCGGDLPVLGLPGSAVHRAAGAARLPIVTEAFADRAYRPDGTLVPRTEPGAVISDPEQVIKRSVLMVTEGSVFAATGERVAVAADSLCLHGDTPGAVELVAQVREALLAAGVTIRPFV
jgi:UPF0271 protein